MKSAIAGLIVAAMAIVLMTASSSAQGVSSGPGGFGGGGHKGKQQNSDKKDAQKTKVDDKAYSAALKSIPDKPFDPWGKMR